MKLIGCARGVTALYVVLAATLTSAALDEHAGARTAYGQAAQTPSVPPSPAVGGAKSVTRFFITSIGMGKGGNLGGLAGADAHCQSLARAEGSGDHIWRAYLSTSETATEPAMNARDRIGSGPWFNAAGELVALNLDELHGPKSMINKMTAVTEGRAPVNGVGDTTNTHDILTGSRSDGTGFGGDDSLTCANWTSGGPGRARVGHHDRMGEGDEAMSWNSAHVSQGCSQGDLQRTGGAGLFYCFAVD